jgi:hypothetical protein
MVERLSWQEASRVPKALHFAWQFPLNDERDPVMMKANDE